MYRRRRQRRRGLALMMVLSLLVLFLLMGVSFLLVASTAEKGARAQAKTELRGDDPRKHVEMAMYQVLCGTKRFGSATPISGHSLLGDLYGNDGATGVVKQIDGSASAQTGGQLIGFTSPLTGPNALNRPWLRQSSANPPSPMPPFIHYLNGRVLTMVSGVAKGLSARIVASGPVSGDYYIRIEAFESDDASLPQPILPAPGDQFVVNGQAFNGSGAGYNPNPAVGGPQYINDRLHPVTGGVESALLPNFLFAAGESVANVGGDDESYDAVDYQNMFLAMVLAGATSSQEIIPSYHRPALINYWRNRLAGATPAQQKQAIRQFVLRPTQLDHPGFSGSNPAFDFPISNPPTAQQLARLYDALINSNGTTSWDVDNDNDGIPDSIWLDLEFPVITSRDGRSVKPLVAILIKDMDGRLNVNAHGNLAQAGNYVNVANGQLVQATGDFAGATGARSTQRIPRGRGYGPAEIYFGHALANPSTEWNSLLTTRYADGLPGRANLNDTLTLLKSLRFPRNYTNERNTSYYSPPDIWGIDTQALNFSGQAWSQYGGLPDPTVDEPYELNLFRFDSAEAGAIDSPFTVAELERLLRYQDLDALVLPDRLLTAAQQSFDSFSATARRRRNLFTTESRHVPVPNTRLDFEQRGLPMTNGADARKAPHIINWLEAKLRSGGMPLAQVDAQVAYQLPFELRRGKPFNVNRLFGNGRDDNGNGVVDEPREIDVANEWVWNNLGSGVHPTFRNIRFDHGNDQPGVTPTTRSRNRQVFARNLYCLMMLLVDDADGNVVGLPNWKIDRFVSTAECGSLSPIQKRELVARRIAQWAINVVDFRDPDAIMTPFEYDLDPFNANGWDTRIDGNPATNEAVGGVLDRRIVWGMEYPDLLISEVKAFHDRRVKDTDVDSSGKKRKDGTREGDPDLDQYRLPQGSLFLEFYCPRNRAETDAAAYTKYPAELYGIQNSPLRGGRPTPVLQLGRMAPTSPTLGQHPVWRVAISEAHHAGATAPTVNAENEAVSRPDSVSFQPEDMSLFGWMNRPASSVPANDEVDVERYIWFASAAPTRTTVPGISRARIYYNRYANADLPAGGYAVVGPRLETRVGSQMEDPTNPNVPDLKTTKPMHLPSPQRIELQPTGALYYDRAGNVHPSIAASRTEPALSIIAAASVPTGWQPRSVDLGGTVGSGVGISVSEPFPDNYYPVEPTESLFAAGTPFDSWYDQADPMTLLPDRPFDERAGMPLENLTNTGTTAQFKTAFLQRLADPTLAYNPAPGYPGHDNTLPVNPYITVDWSTIDLTVFSGEEDTNRRFDITMPAPRMNIWIDPSDQDPYNAGPPELFDTRAKGRAKLAVGAPAPLQDINIWTHATTTPQNRPRGAGAEYFKIDLRNTMGFLNSTYGAPRDVPTAYRGDPAQPWPWLTWSSRPFDSPLELMNVPASTLSRLPHEFISSQSPANPYGDADRDQLIAPYHHLLNFFDASANQYQSPHFYRIFDYVETPSPFMGAERLYLPAQFAGGVAAEGFRPPYNYLSRFRDPGRINVNTIFEREVWEGIAKGFPDMDPSLNATTWNNLLVSRQGYGNIGNLRQPDPRFPTLFANPFRAAAANDSGPIRALREYAPFNGTNVKPSIQATLLRSAPASLAENSPPSPQRPLFDFTSTNQFNNTSRNPALRFAGVQRLSNLLTTHSNVFSVWITVGYFEVEQVPISGINRSGYRLKQEAGLDTGEVERHRAFYIIDRSIPVAYEPGENHNVDKCVLVRRFIE